MCSNDDAGSFGAVLIVFGLIGAALAGAWLVTPADILPSSSSSCLLCSGLVLLRTVHVYSTHPHPIMLYCPWQELCWRPPTPTVPS